jgi:hypothetical protein
MYDSLSRKVIDYMMTGHEFVDPLDLHFRMSSINPKLKNCYRPEPDYRPDYLHKNKYIVDAPVLTHHNNVSQMMRLTQSSNERFDTFTHHDSFETFETFKTLTNESRHNIEIEYKQMRSNAWRPIELEIKLEWRSGTTLKQIKLEIEGPQQKKHHKNYSKNNSKNYSKNSSKNCSKPTKYHQ